MEQVSGKLEPRESTEPTAEVPYDAASRLRRAFIVLAVFVAVELLPMPAGVTSQGQTLLAIFLAAIAGLMLRPMPGGAIVLLAITAAAATGTLSIERALGGYADPTVWLVISAFLISRALLKTGLARRIALLFVRLFGQTSLGVCYALGCSDMVLASIIPSNAARSGGVILPIARSIAELYDSYPGQTATRLGAFLMAAVYQSVCITAAMFYTGQASNPLAARLAGQEFNVQITWFSWFAAAIVPGLLALFLVPLVVFKVFPPEIRRTPRAKEYARQQLQALGPMKPGEKISALVFLAVCLLWVTEPWHGLHLTITALSGACALLVSGVLTWTDVREEKAAWDIFVWYGGLLQLGKELNATGVSSAAAQALGGLLGTFSWPVLLLIAVALYFYVHYLFASITAHILSLYIPFITILTAAGAPALLTAYLLAFASNLSAGLTHYGTTPAPMFFAHGYVSFRDWWRVGLLCSVVNLIVWGCLGLVWWKLLGLW